MRSATVTDFKSISSTFGGGGIRLEGKTEKGEKIGVAINQERFMKLAAMTQAAGSIGHALWHLQNPYDRFPCSYCKPIASK